MSAESQRSYCPLCKPAVPAPQGVSGHHRLDFYDCPRCGRFAIDSITTSRIKGRVTEHYKTSAIVRERTVRDRRVLLTCGTEHPRVEGFELLSFEDTLTTLYPRRFSDRLDRALLNLAKLSDYAGKMLDIKHDNARALVFARHRKESYYTFKALAAVGWTKTVTESVATVSVEVTPEGWNRVADLEAARTGEPIAQAFVAMWFGSREEERGNVSSDDFCTNAYRTGFEAGIRSAGYDPVRIDFKEFNDDVVDEIITEIRRSRFVVADFTGHRCGVYFEAGFARGLDLPVINTCHESDIKGAHFDTRNYNHLVWKTPEDLAERLERRIIATIREGPLRSDAQ